MPSFDHLLEAALETPGWRYPDDLLRLAEEAHSINGDVVIVEIGCFFGRSTLMLAGARKVRGQGVVHCIDPFDARGDSFSAPHYERMLASNGGGSLRAHFEANLARLHLLDWVRIHQQTAETAAPLEIGPIDLLLLDGDQSPDGALFAYERWLPLLKRDGVLVIGNSADRAYDPGHDGHARILENCLPKDGFRQIERGDTTFARYFPMPARA